MKKYKTPGEKKGKAQGQKWIEGVFIKKDMENVNKKISWTRFPEPKRNDPDSLALSKPSGRKWGALGLAKSSITIILMIIYLLFNANVAVAFRCGSDLISIGDRSFTVLRKCGEPISKEVMGYTLTGDKKREFKIEEWIYGPIGSRYYHLIFEGGKLVKIESIPE